MHYPIAQNYTIMCKFVNLEMHTEHSAAYEGNAVLLIVAAVVFHTWSQMVT